MRQLSFWTAALLLLLALTGPGCASNGLIQPKEGEEFNLKLKAKPGDPPEVHHYFSDVFTEKYEDGQLIKKENEAVEFDLWSQFKGFMGEQKEGLRYDITVKNKDGVADLHAMAFPEENETIQFVFSPNYDVLHAGRFPKNSVFFVPPLVLPKEPVKVGDTWSLSRSWNGLYNGLPLKIDILSIFKGLYKCPDQMCAVIEVNARVKLLGKIAKITRFNSLIRGRFLVGVKDSAMYWSSLNSEESFATASTRSDVRSCIVSALKKPESRALGFKANSCNYNLNVVPPLP